MKAAEYEELREALLHKDTKVLDAVRSKYTWVQYDTLMAIRSQERSRRVRLQHPKFRARQRIQEYIARYFSPFFFFCFFLFWLQIASDSWNNRLVHIFKVWMYVYLMLILFLPLCCRSLRIVDH
jgi:hypothetical protein